LLFKAPEVLGYFYGLAFSSQRNWGNPSSSTGIPLHFYDVLSKSSTHLFSAATAELEERKRRRYHVIKATEPCFIYFKQISKS